MNVYNDENNNSLSSVPIRNSQLSQLSQYNDMNNNSTIAISSLKGGCTESCKGNQRNQLLDDELSKKVTPVPWPVIIVAIIGIIIILYIAIGPYISNSKRIFGVTLLILWTLIWCLLLWVLWSEGYYSMSWWLMLIPIFTMVIFFAIVIILLN